MNSTNNNALFDAREVGHEMYRLIATLYPICRSITGNGVRETLKILQSHIPIEVHEVPSGTPVFDWVVPKEWNIREAHILNARGEKVVDFKKNNLHIVSYSVPMRKKLSLTELMEHLFTLPEHPDWIPYRTSYYDETWGFCLSHRQMEKLKDGMYEVVIDSTLENGHLTYGEYFLPGSSTDEILISCHICHPSLCNDNLSGIALATFLAKRLQTLSRRFSYRFLFIPGTIGSITWLALNEPGVSRIKHGLVLSCVGDAGTPTYKKSRRGDAEIDRVMAHVLKKAAKKHEILDYSPYGYDERQYGSPGFNLPIGCFMRTPYGRYPEYHTSADNLDFVRAEALADSLEICTTAVRMLEGNPRYRNLNPKCEPQLGRRGLYQKIGGGQSPADQMALLWTLNLCDGDHSLLDVAERSGLDFQAIRQAADMLLEKGLIEEVR